MNYTQEEKVNLKKKGIAKPNREVNKLEMMSKGEGLNHFLTKAIIFWHLRMEDHKVYSEAKTKKGKIDVIDDTRKFLIEVETSKSIKRYEKDMRKLTNDFRNMIVVNSIDIPYELKVQIKDILKKLELL